MVNRGQGEGYVCWTTVVPVCLAPQKTRFGELYGEV